MAFLDYLLGGVSGGFEGYERKKAKDLEAQRYADEQERQRKSEARQLAMDIANLQSQGYEDAPEVRRKQQAALNTAGTLGVAALNSVLGGPPGALPSKTDQELLLKGYATAKPERAIDYGGRQFALRETPAEREDRLARAQEMKAYRDKQTEIERARKTFVSAYPSATPQQIEAMVGGIKPENIGLENLTPSQKRAQERQAQLDKLDEQYKRAQIANLLRDKESTTTGTGPIDFTNDLQIIQDFLPTIGPDGKTVKPKRQLSGQKSLAVQQGGPSGTFLGQVANLALTTYGADLTNEQLYNTIAEGIATAYAIQEQRGRNVSDRDIANRIAQIKVLPNEVGSLEVQNLKGQRLQQWANRLMRGDIPQVQPGQTYKVPVYTPAPSGRPPISSFDPRAGKR